MRTIRQSYKINAPIEKVWEALIDPKVINAWGGGPAKMNGEVGALFSLWGGDIHGKNLAVVPNKLLKQEWISKDNDEPGSVTFILKDAKGGTTLSLEHTGISDKSFDDLSDGWKNYYLGPLKNLVES